MILVGDTKVKFTTFPNGETKMDEDQLLSCIYDGGVLTLKYENDLDLIKLLFVKKYLDVQGYTVSLLISYMPYSRMDRTEMGSAFTLKYVAEFINNLNFKYVTVLEPHSEVTLALLDNVDAVYPTVDMLGKVMAEIGFNENENDFLFFPDAGAQKRYGKYFKGIPSAVGIKTRDFVTGNIEHLRVIGFEDGDVSKPPLRKVIIIDDLCSRGGTFLAAGNRLKELGAEEVYLLVTHCEHNIFTGLLFNDNSPIDKIFCTDTIINWNDVPNYLPSHLQSRLEVFKQVGGSSGE